ncbi:thiamine pyrophosphate-binding protein [Chloroflexota bacterium]
MEKVTEQGTENLYWDPVRPWGSELVANSLVDHGVECVFCLCGGHIESTLKSAADKGIKVVGTRTESAAVYAAAGYAIASGKTGVVILTAAMSTLAGWAITNISWGQIPVVLISGTHESYAYGLRGLQEMDQIPFARASFAKEAFHVAKWERIPEQLGWAFTAAEKGVPGCAFIDIPIDILASRGEASSVKPWYACTDARPAGDPMYVKEAVKILSESKQPILNVARMAVAAGAQEEIREFVELTRIPVDACLGTVGEHELNLGAQLCPDADVALMLGKQSQGIPGSMNFIQYTGKLINMYPEAEDFGHCYPVDIGIVGDVRLVLRQIIEEAKKVKFPDFSPWVDEIKQRRAGFKAYLDQLEQEARNNKPIHPLVCTKAVLDWMIDNKLHKEALISVDGAENLIWWFQATMASGTPHHFPGQAVSLTSFQHSLGSVGIGLALGLGGAVAQPDRFLVAPSIGDGAFAYHMAELETMARENIPAVIVIHNNSAWGMVYADQRRIWGRDPENAPGTCFLPDLHYEKVAEGLGCPPGEFVEEPGGIRPALDRAYERALADRKPVVVNVITDRNIYALEYPWWLLPATPSGEPYALGR